MVLHFVGVVKISHMLQGRCRDVEQFLSLAFPNPVAPRPVVMWQARIGDVTVTQSKAPES